MTGNDQRTATVGDILQEGLAAAQRDGASQVHSQHLSAEQFDQLAGATLAHLRSRQGKPSHIAGWQKVSPRAAGVMRWWAETASLTDAQRRRLRPLRQEVFSVLEERNLIEKGPGRGSSVHVSPEGHGDVAEEHPAERPEVPEETFGAWVLKLSPYVYDSNLVFAASDRLVRRWSVEEGDRSATMQYGQPAFLWVGDGDPLREPGIWGLGWVVGPCVSGTPDAGWFDYGAASRATLFAVVEITLIDTPVSRSVFLDDPRLSGAEVIREPVSGNPSLLTPAEAAALAEHLTFVPALPDPVSERGAT